MDLATTRAMASSTLRYARAALADADGVLEAAQQEHGQEGRRHAADRELQRQAQVDGAPAEVRGAADGLRHRRVEEVGADRADGRHAGDHHEQRGHDRAAADAGGAHEQAHAEPEQHHQEVVAHRIGPPAGCSPHSVFSLPVQRPSRPLPGLVQWVQPIEE